VTVDRRAGVGEAEDGQRSVTRRSSRESLELTAVEPASTSNPTAATGGRIVCAISLAHVRDRCETRSVRVVSIDQRGDIYVARDADDEVIWTVELRLDMRGTPFRDEVLWPAASLVVIAGGAAVHFLSPESGAIVKTLSLDDDLFGRFGPTDSDLLYILGWQNVIAVDTALAVRWVSRGVAVDGIIWTGCEGNRIQLSAEMDPPGGWVDVELDVVTGREVSRGRPLVE
jgi:hypothetical protein